MAEGYKGNYAPELFNEGKRYTILQAQQLSSLTDAELRDMHQMSNAFVQRVVQGQVGDSVIGDGFKIIQHPTDSTNNFRITGGDGTLDNPGVLFLKGHRLFLRNSIGYKDQTNTGTLTDDPFTETVLPALTTPTGTDQTLNAVVGSSGVTVVVGNAGTIVRSSDSGRNFIPRISGTSDILYDVDFGDASSVFAVGPESLVLKSINAGSTWAISPPPLDGTNTVNLYGVSFVDQNNGYVVGGSGFIFGTTDGGSNWTQHGAGTTSETLRAIDLFDSTRVWTVGDNGTVVYFDGTGWSLQNSDTTKQLKDVEVTGTSTALVCGLEGLIKKTTDFGATWVDKTSGTTVDLYGLSFSDATLGWAVGSSGIVTRTLDGGETWTSQTVDASCNFYSVFFSDTTGFAVGDNGIIYRSTDGTTWEKYRTDYVYVDFHLAEVSADTTGGSEYIDTDLEDMVVGPPNSNRLRIVQDVKVSEGWKYPANYMGMDGTVATVQHYTYPLARIQRTINNPVISQSEITDLRIRVRTIAELNDVLNNGGIDASAIAPGSIGPDKLIPGADYTFGSVQVLGDTTIAGDLTVEGILHVEDFRTSTFMDSLTVSGSTVLGDTSSPFDDTVNIYGSIIQMNDTTAVSYDLHSLSTTLTSPVFNIQQDGSGAVFKIQKLNDSTICIFDVTSYGNGYDFCITHLANNGGVFRAEDDSTGNTFYITKDASGALGSVFNITSNSLGPVFDIVNNALGSPVSVKIDQTGGIALNVKIAGDATGLYVHSSGCTDIKIQHDGTSGHAIDIISSASDSAVKIDTSNGQAIYVDQHANETAVTINKDSTGYGRALEVNHQGLDPAVQINNDGSAISLHVSHTGFSYMPAVDIYVAGNERGPALRINKANRDSTDDIGQAAYIRNQGFSETLEVFQDNTDSTAAVVRIVNGSLGYDMSSAFWWVDRSGSFVTEKDMTSPRFAFDSTHYVAAASMWLDGSNFDSSNPAILGRVFTESGFLRISDGTSPLPIPTWGATGPQGTTGLQGATGIGFQGVTGIAGAGYTGLQGATGVQGETGPSGGPQGTTGIQGSQGQTGPSGGPQGATGLRGPTGTQGLTGIQGTGVTGLQGITGTQGSTGIRGITGPAGGPQGATGLRGTTGLQGMTGLSGTPSPFSFNGVSRYEVVSTAGEEVWCESSSTVYHGLSWTRSGTVLTINRTGHGHLAGNRVVIRNTNMDYQVVTIDTITANSFNITTSNVGATSGNDAAYSLGFTFAHIGMPKTGGTLTAPSGDHADVQLIALRVRTNGRSGTTYDLVVPASAINGAGSNTNRGDCFIPDFNVRFDSDTLSAVGATMAVNNGGSGYNSFRFGNLGSNSVFIVTHF